MDLSDISTGIDIRQQGQTLVVELLKTKLPDTLRKRFDVVDFATPVQTMMSGPVAGVIGSRYLGDVCLTQSLIASGSCS